MVISQSSTASTRPGIGCVEHQVVQLVIVVHQCGRAGDRQAVHQPADQAGHFGDLFDFGALPTVGPAAHLPLQEARRLAQKYAIGIHLVESGQAIHEALADAAAEIRRRAVIRRHIAPQHDAVAAFHDEENRADDVRVLAQQEHLRSRLEHRMHRAQDAIFPRHVVGFGRHRTERRPAQDILASTGLQQVSQVGVAARKLLDAQSRLYAFQLAAQVAGQDTRVDLLAWAKCRHRCHRTSAIGRMGEPVPPRILSGIATKTNS